MVIEHKFKSNKINDIIDEIGSLRNVSYAVISEKLFWSIVPRIDYGSVDDELIIYINSIKVYGVDYLDGLRAFVSIEDLYVSSSDYIFNTNDSTYISYPSYVNFSDLISSFSIGYSCTNNNHCD